MSHPSLGDFWDAVPMSTAHLLAEKEGSALVNKPVPSQFVMHWSEPGCERGLAPGWAGVWAGNPWWNRERFL